jgi:K+-sensing histidine kinase KdpD
VADTRAGEPLPSSPIHVVLESRQEDASPRWSRTHVATGSRRADRGGQGTVFRVGIVLAGEALGSLWAVRVGDKRDPDPAETRIIDAEAERMNRLVRNLLDLSRIEGGALHPDLEPHDVDECVDPVVRRIATHKLISVDLAADLPPVLVDGSYLDEVLTNLVENAVRYGGDTIRVTAVERRAEGTVVITVEDDGAGVPEADRARLFEKFYRVRGPREGSRRGMGIGLTVARGLTLAMGGSISADLSDLGGLAFRVTLPAARRPTAEVTSRPGSAAEDEGSRE